MKILAKFFLKKDIDILKLGLYHFGMMKQQIEFMSNVKLSHSVFSGIFPENSGEIEAEEVRIFLYDLYGKAYLLEI